MSSTSIENKTVRPGGTFGYAYYRSARQPARGRSGSKSQQRARRRRPVLGWGLLVVAVLAAIVAGPLVHGDGGAKPPAAAKTASSHTAQATPPSKPAAQPAAAPAAAVPAATNHCANNQLGQLVLVSISQRHLWACNGATEAYDSPVVTGIEYLAADLTPTGTYHIYDKIRDTHLTGSDSTGSWNDFVYYWMPFMHNQYGTYGLHDATWRADSDFGNISPDSADASHGCVELPLATAAWLYNWVQIGTTVTIQS